MTIRLDDVRQDAVIARREELLTVKEYAGITRHHPQSIYRRIRHGRQSGVVRDGREIFIDVTLALRPSV